jgi:hypothetical protein
MIKAVFSTLCVVWYYGLVDVGWTVVVAWFLGALLVEALKIAGKTL